ncbi:uncharacterized protein PAN0_029c6201 [Moesziomyces antarcticus]|uniref:Uncharacterized protein n=2 Tax=Pseudozyma antarctica TaxID=84753 RepID=A0A5C3FSM4_PSEA2|nr:uncharacterized protein PAN0_029c6201 [Moesziomyces antarcticus]GAK67971.1 hypothetical protein PAN0_029c6201 [Moesziomyces antarcticus]SPO47302.1 uncharacterized protein PSANT_04990 [Moesziomyces antarcticus]
MGGAILHSVRVKCGQVVSLPDLTSPLVGGMQTSENPNIRSTCLEQHGVSLELQFENQLCFSSSVTISCAAASLVGSCDRARVLQTSPRILAADDCRAPGGLADPGPCWIGSYPMSQIDSARLPNHLSAFAGALALPWLFPSHPSALTLEAAGSCRRCFRQQCLALSQIQPASAEADEIVLTPAKAFGLGSAHLQQQRPRASRQNLPWPPSLPFCFGSSRASRLVSRTSERAQQDRFKDLYSPL